MFKAKIKRRFSDVFEYAKGNLFFVGLLAVTCFPLYYFIWKYTYPQQYENLPLRIFCAALFIPWMAYNSLPEKFSKIFPHYFFGSLFFCIPFFFTYMLFANSFSEIWSMAMLAGIYLMGLLIDSVVITTLMFCASLLINCAIFGLMKYDVNFANFDNKYIPIYLFALVSAALCNRNEARNRVRFDKVKSIGGNVAHEMRNSLNAINLLARRIKDVAGNISQRSSDKDINEILRTTNTILNCTSRSNDVINLILSNLKNEHDDSGLQLLLVNEILQQAVKEYAYNNERERRSIKLDLQQDFVIKAEKSACIYIMFNLIKNSLYYFNSKQDLTINIYTKSAHPDFNQIIIEDNGPGISKEKLKSVFSSFYTFGKIGGTGLGLDFCKRMMESFFGKIECHSEVGKYTRFILSFPKIGCDLNVVKDLNLSRKSVKLLLVDDQEAVIKVTKKLIKDNIKNVEIDSTTNSFEAINMVRNGRNYDTILMDIQMPSINGYEASRLIRRLDKNVPIIAYSSDFGIKYKVLESNMNEYISKIDNKDILIRSICKWNLLKYIPKNYQFSSKFGPKRVMLVDDNAFSLASLKRNLRNSGFVVEAYDNANDLFDNYVKKVANNQIKNTLILADIAMPMFDGIELARKIAKYNQDYNVEFDVPLINCSVDFDLEKARYCLNNGAIDYFVKGDDFGYLVDLINFWLFYSYNQMMGFEVSANPIALAN